MDKAQKQCAQQALAWLEGVSDNCTVDEIEESIREYLGKDFDISRIRKLIPCHYDDRIKVNLYTVYTLICLFTHHYPDEVYGADVYSDKNTEQRYKDAYKEYMKVCDDLTVPSRLKALHRQGQELMGSGIRADLTARFLAVSDFKNCSMAEFLSDTAVLKDKIYTARYTPSKWAALIKKTREYAGSCQKPVYKSDVNMRKWELHASTVMGENHTKCDDCSMVMKIDSDAWFAFSSDGVGSASQSHIGSYLAGQCFYTCITNAYRHLGAEKLAYYVQHTLASHAAGMWKHKIAQYQADAQPERFACTFLFAFGCKSFVACGIIGDGNYIVQKKVRINGKDTYGYLKLDDGVSGVVHSGVLTVPHLLYAPSAMQIRFFDPREVEGILMCSDGANGILFEEIGGVLLADRKHLLNSSHVFEQLSTPDFFHTCEIVNRLCEKYSCANKYGGGRGDDCSIVYIKPRR